MQRRYSLLVAAILGASAWGQAAVLTWDSSAANPATPVDGSGTWDTASANWSDGTNDNIWNNANNDTAVFGNGGPAGTVTVQAAGVTTGGITFNSVASGNYILTGGTITLGAASDTIAVNAGSPTINSVLAGSGVALAINGGGTLVSNVTAETYSGSTTITNTTVNIGNGDNADVSAPFGAAGNTVTLTGATIFGKGSSSGGSISYQTPYNFVINGTDTINTGKNFTLGSGGTTTLTTVSGNGTLVMNESGSASNDTGNIRGAGFAGTGSNAFTGTLEVTGVNSGATVRAYANTSQGNFTGVPNGTLDLEGVVSFAPQTNSGGNAIALGALMGSSTTAILAGGSAGAPTYSIGGLGASTTFAGTITGNSIVNITGGNLTVTNSGNTYTGATTISGGTLYDNGAITASQITVNSGATLAGSGSAGALASINGEIAPGTSASTIGTLTFAAGLNLGSTGTYLADLNLAGQSDMLSVTGNLNLGGATLDANVLDATSGGTYTIATYTGTLTGTFGSLDLPAGYSVNYGTGINSAITLMVPEPDAMIALVGLAIGLRRKRSSR